MEQGEPLKGGTQRVEKAPSPSSGRAVFPRSNDPDDANNSGDPEVNSDQSRFPARLHRMLADVQKNGEGLEKIVSWQPHGRCKSNFRLYAELVT